MKFDIFQPVTAQLEQMKNNSFIRPRFSPHDSWNQEPQPGLQQRIQSWPSLRSARLFSTIPHSPHRTADAETCLFPFFVLCARLRGTANFCTLEYWSPSSYSGSLLTAVSFAAVTLPATSCNNTSSGNAVFVAFVSTVGVTEVADIDSNDVAAAVGTKFDRSDVDDCAQSSTTSNSCTSSHSCPADKQRVCCKAEGCVASSAAPADWQSVDTAACAVDEQSSAFLGTASEHIYSRQDITPNSFSEPYRPTWHGHGLIRKAQL